MFQWAYHEHLSIQISTLLPVVSSLTMTVTEKTTDMTLESGITEDTTSGRENLFKNYIHNSFVWKYPLWDM